MSLLNEVLRDLDARGGSAATPELRVAQRIGNPPAPSRRGIDWPRLVAWTLVAGGVLVAGYAWWQPPADYPPVRPQPVMVQAPSPEERPTAADVQPVRPTPGGLRAQLQPLQPIPAAPAEPGPVTATPRQAHAVTVGPEVPTPDYLPLRIEPADEAAGPAVTTSKHPPASASVKQMVRTPVAAPALDIDRIRNLVDSGELSEAERLLRLRLKQQPRDAAAHELLVGVLLRGARNAEVLQHIDTAPTMVAARPVLRLIRARLLLEQGDIGQAETLLHGLLRDAPEHADALRLLAALRQQAGDQVTAAALYLRLVGLPGRSARDWLGLALSSDGRDDTVALNAYREVLRAGDLEPQVIAYARQRFAALMETGQ